MKESLLKAFGRTVTFKNPRVMQLKPSNIDVLLTDLTDRAGWDVRFTLTAFHHAELGYSAVFEKPGSQSDPVLDKFVIDNARQLLTRLRDHCEKSLKELPP